MSKGAEIQNGKYGSNEKIIFFTHGDRFWRHRYVHKLRIIRD